MGHTDELILEVFQETPVDSGLLEAIVLSVVLLRSGRSLGTGIHHFMGCHPFLGKFTILGQWLNLLPRNLLQVDLAYLSYVQLKSQGLRACRSMTRH